MDELLKIFGIFSASSVVVFAILKYGSQRIFESFLKKSIETHKSELERINISHQIQFASLHKERAIVIKDIYYRLYDYKSAVIHFFLVELSDTDPSGDLKNRINEWSNAVLNFSQYFHKHRIYFDTSLCSLLDDINNELDSINQKTGEFNQSFNSIEDQLNAIKTKSQSFLDLKDRSQTLLEKTILPVSEQLEKEFRKILGVES